MHSSEVFLWRREILMSRQHQVRPLSPGVLCNCCQPQPEMCVMNLEVKSCMAWSSPAASQLTRAERHRCTSWEGTGKKVTLHHPQPAGRPTAECTDCSHSSSQGQWCCHSPFQGRGIVNAAFSNPEIRPLGDQANVQRYRTAAQKMWGARRNLSVLCFVGAGAGLGAKQWVGNAWPLHALPFLSPCPMLLLFSTFQHSSKYLFCE